MKCLTRFGWWVVLAAAALTGCEQNPGSDIGPRLLPLPDGDYRLLVRDDSGRPVSGAKVSIAGVTTTAATNNLGRAVVRAVFGGDRAVTVSGDNASAVDTDALGQLTMLAAPVGAELPFVVYLPDVSASAGLPVTTGAQGAPISLDDSSRPSGAILEVAAGETVTFGTQTSVTLKTGVLQAEHLPPGIPDAGAVPRYSGRGFYLAPLGVQFALGATLSLPNDLGVGGGGTADLMRLDPVSGTWQQVGSGIESSGRIRAVAAITTGGLYCFASPGSGGTTTVRGTVVDTDDEPVFGVLVRVPNVVTSTNAAGVFQLDVPTQDVGANNRTVNLVLDGGRDLFPTRLTRSVNLAGKEVDLGKLELDTFAVTDLRLLLVVEGSGQPNRRLSVASVNDGVVATGFTDSNATACFEDVPAGRLGIESGTVRDFESIFRTLGSFTVALSQRDSGLSFFSQSAPWRSARAGNNTRIRPVDRRGSGPLSGVTIVVGSVAGTGLSGVTNDFGLLDAPVGRNGQVTVVRESEVAGKKVTSAVTLVKVDSGDQSVPLEQSLRSIGAFERHGLVSGALLNSAGGATQRRVRASGLMTLQDWFEQVFLDRPPLLGLPRKLDPQVAGGSNFLIGLPSGISHLAAAEGTDTGGVFQLDRLGLGLSVSVAEGERRTLDLSMDLLANQTFVVTNGVANLDASIAPADLRVDLAGQLSSGLLVDLVRGVGGNHQVVGNELRYTLPAVPPGLTRYLIATRGTATSAGVTIDQRSFVEHFGTAAVDVPMLAPPAISSPTPGQTVTDQNLVVQFTTPSSALYTVLQLRSETANDVRDWTVVLPPEATQFQFMELPKDVPDPVIAGRTYTLKATSVRLDRGVLLSPRLTDEVRYLQFLASIVSINEADRGAGAFASVSFTVQT